MRHNWTRNLRPMNAEEVRSWNARRAKWQVCGDTPDTVRIRVNPDGSHTVEHECFGVWCEGHTENERPVHETAVDVVGRGFTFVGVV